jgi:1-deoxy-D-xylulose-5-phosphate reductoisomerase
VTNDVAPASIAILGSTGSIGKSTLDVIQRHSQYKVFALSAHSNVDMLFAQCLQFHPELVVMVDEKAASNLQKLLRKQNLDIEVLAGAASLIQISTHESVDTVMAAIVGSAGLEPTLAAVKSSKKVLLANKESLVMAGELFIQAVADSGACLLPIDSEHNAIHQCLPEFSAGRICFHNSRASLSPP